MRKPLINIALNIALLAASLILLFCYDSLAIENTSSNSLVSDISEKRRKSDKKVSSRIIETGNDVIIDGSLRILEQNFIKSTDLVEISTPVTPASNHGRIFLRADGTGQTLAFVNDAGTVVPLGGSGVVAGDITEVTAGLGLVGGGTAGSVTLFLSTPIANSFIDASSITKQGQDVITFSSATSTYLQLSSATATYLQSSSASLTYLTIPNAASSYLTQSSASVTYANLISSQSFTGQNTFDKMVTISTTAVITAIRWPNGTIQVSSPTTGSATGTVVQSSQCTTILSSSTSAGTYRESSVRCTITPTSSSNRVKVSLTCEAQQNTGAGTSSFTLLRDYTNLMASNGFTALQLNMASTGGRIPLSLAAYIDSPGSTSALRYALGFLNNNSATVTINDLNGTCIMLLEEIN